MSSQETAQGESKEAAGRGRKELLREQEVVDYQAPTRSSVGGEEVREVRAGDKELDLEFLEAFAKGIVNLSIDMVEKARSGHPGLPLGLARLGAYLYGHFLDHDPKNPTWLARDRCILSAGHGSAWLYSALHLCGYDLSLEELKNFRQLHSRTPGHPEYSPSEGIETTSGPLGQGLAHAVGQALALKIVGQRLKQPRLFDAKVVAVAGDGCMMEGVQYEAMSFAGHLGLDNLIVAYDANKVCLDGELRECMSEDVAQRALAQGWQVRHCSGKDFVAMDHAFADLKIEQKQPVLVLVSTEIGEGAPTKAGTSAAHGAPLGESEALAAKKAWGIEQGYSAFQVDATWREKAAARMAQKEKKHALWQESFAHWRCGYVQEAQQLEEMCQKKIDLEKLSQKCAPLLAGKEMATRAASSLVLQELGDYPSVLTGSADLSSSDKCLIKKAALIAPNCFEGANIKFGVREFAMGAMAAGLSESGFFLPVIGTFLTFSDYMRNAIRLSALMRLQIIYHFTHDSVLLGEDGPTHQPIEQIMSLRLIPGLQVLRPADPYEALYAWRAALGYNGPSALILSRQGMRDLGISKLSYEEATARGGYLLWEGESPSPSTSSAKDLGVITFIATGSEVALALEVAKNLSKEMEIDARVRLINMPSWELFEDQDRSYQEALLSLGRVRHLIVSVEAGSTLGWGKIAMIGAKGALSSRHLAIGVDDFGLSAPESAAREALGLTEEALRRQVVDAWHESW